MKQQNLPGSANARESNESKGHRAAQLEDAAERFNRVLSDVVQAMDKMGVRYVFIGGIASGGLGRPRSTQDIDIFVIPEEADLALEGLARFGFRIERTDPSWLFKGFKDDILVDVIFKSKGDIYLDSEMYQRMITAEFHGQRLRLVSPEDLLIIKAAAHSELTPGHWHDAIALLSHATIDWSYLLRRARRAPRRVLSLLLYAQSNDIWIPNDVIHELYRSIFGNFPLERVENRPIPPVSRIYPDYSFRRPREEEKTQVYALAHLREKLAVDPRTNELDIQMEERGGQILLSGEVQSEDRKEAVEKIAREIFPTAPILNQIRVSEFGEIQDPEDVA